MKAVSFALTALVTAGKIVSDGVNLVDNPSVASESSEFFVGFSDAKGAERAQSFVHSNGGVVNKIWDEIKAMSISGVNQAALDALSRSPGVDYVEVAPVHYLAADTVPYGLENTRARESWDANNDGTLDAATRAGSGKVVCVIDSGGWSGHPDLADNLIGGRNYYGSNQENTNWDTSSLACNHGIHCAGTVGAALNGLGVVGVAPEVKIWVGRVFGESSGGDDCLTDASSTAILNALDGCFAAGHRIASLSLGSDLFSQTELRKHKQLYDSGMLVFAAAGNGGNRAKFYPASYLQVISVGATDSSNNIASFSQFNYAVDLSAPGVGILSTFLESPTYSINGVNFAAEVMEFSGSHNFVGMPVHNTHNDCCIGTPIPTFTSGQVAHCRRGNCTYTEKADNVIANGAGGLFFSNNVPGTATGSLGSTKTIGVLSVSQSTGDMLDGLSAGLTTQLLAAPIGGGGVYASYNFKSGTSMACPHVAGIAAAVWGARPSATHLEVEACLYSTALDLGTSGKDIYYGHGLVQMKPAIDCIIGNASPPTCNDGVQNGNETGVDCGGSCPVCPACNDGIRNGDEVAIDCGGSCNACPATCNDSIRNGDELAIDCGGSCSACTCGTANQTCSGGRQGTCCTGLRCSGNPKRCN